ncbi:MAG TPA: DUF4321 domain-containing protein [Candidatus Polarisedimenticolia bacterium]|nr:DUF4321 domain-containing protein [Candidatus Polarisedimenticolia bacterium]
MAKGGLKISHLVVVVILAALIGTSLGDLMHTLWPMNPTVTWLAEGIRVGTNAPLDIDMRVAQLTLGAGIRLTILGGLCAVFALFFFVRRV